jgi:TIR domain-containing protein
MCSEGRVMADGTPDVGKSAAAEARKLKVFISYSRDDLDFADQLVAALELCGFDPTIDRHGISGGEAWQQRLGALILEADTVVFVLSPASARSSICTWEVTEAARLSKRILPVLARVLDGASPPQLLQDLNYVHFYHEPRAPGSGFGVGLAALVASLNTDLDWIREHTRLLERATEWAARGRPVNRLLSGSDIADAKKWVNERPKGAPEPTARHLEFIRASEDQETLRASSERQRLEEMAAAQEERAKALRAAEEALRKEAEAQRARARARSIITWGSAAAVLVLAVAFAFAMLQTFEADRQRAEAQAYLRDAQITQSRALADAAQREATEGDYATGILLSLEALPDATQKFERTIVTEARRSLSLGLDFLRERFVFDGDASLSPDGRLVLTRPAGKAPRLWDATAGRELFVLGRPDQTADIAAFSPDGQHVLTSPRDTAPRLWDAATGKELVIFGGTAQEPASSAWFSPDGNLVITTLDGKPPRLWQSATGKELFVLGDQNEDVRGVSFSPDSKFVLTWPNEGSPRLWSTATGSEAFALGGG